MSRLAECILGAANWALSVLDFGEISPEAPVAVLALDQRIRESVHVTGRLPDARVHQDGRIQPLDVVALVDHRTPPEIFDVTLELDPQRTVVPNGTGPSVDLRGLEDVATPLGERHDLVHQIFSFSHGRD